MYKHLNKPNQKEITNMKIAVNRCFGGFGLSQRAYERLVELGAKTYTDNKPDDESELYIHDNPRDADTIFGRYYVCWDDDTRTNPMLIQMIEELGSDAASGDCGQIEIIEIPDGVCYEIDDYDGIETVHECHRS